MKTIKSKNNLKTYKRLLRQEANHWDEFEIEMIEKNKIIPWWVDLRNATKLINSPAGLSPKKEQIIRGKYRQKIIDCCKSKDRVLDIGCGSGWLSLELARKGCEVFAVDISAYRINIARSYYKKKKEEESFSGIIHYCCVDINTFRLPDRLDTVVAWDSLHHLPNVERLYVKINQSLKRGGSFVFYDHVGSSFIKDLGKLRNLIIKDKVSAFEDVSQREILDYMEKYFDIVELRYLISAPLRLLIYFLFRFDISLPFIKMVVDLDERITFKTRIFGGEYVFVKCQKS